MKTYTLAQAARLLGTGRNRLIRELKQRGILDHNRVPAQRHIDAGRFTTELRQHTRNPLWNDGNGQLYTAALLTPKGLIWLAELLGKPVQFEHQQHQDVNRVAVEAIRLLRMHIQTPTAVDSATALAVAEEALQHLEAARSKAA